MRKFGLFVLSLLMFVVGAGAGLVGVHFYTLPKTDVLDQTKLSIVNGELAIHFLELGNIYTGDCVYIKAGETDILIDAGSKNESTYSSAPTIISYLNQYVADNTLEYVIATHAHEDHLAAFYSTSKITGIFDSFKTETIIDFPNTNKENPGPTSVLGRYITYRDKEVEQGATHYTALQCYNQTDGAKRVYELADGIELEILYNFYYDHNVTDKNNNFVIDDNETSEADENDYSVCVMINQGTNHYLLTGDLEESGEAHLVDYYEQHHGGLPKCVLFKGGHHGSVTSSSDKLLDVITPEYVCVCTCCGTSEYTDNSSTQFVTQEFINRVSKHTENVYVTTMVDNYVSKDEWEDLGTVKSMNGNIVFAVNNGVITINCSNNNTKLKDTQWFKDNRTCPTNWQESA